MMTSAPARANSRAAIWPIPLLAPVITAMRSCWSGISAAVQGIGVSFRGFRLGRVRLGYFDTHNARCQLECHLAPPVDSWPQHEHGAARTQETEDPRADHRGG